MNKHINVRYFSSIYPFFYILFFHINCRTFVKLYIISNAISSWLKPFEYLSKHFIVHYTMAFMTVNYASTMQNNPIIKQITSISLLVHLFCGIEIKQDKPSFNDLVVPALTNITAYGQAHNQGDHMHISFYFSIYLRCFINNATIYTIHHQQIFCCWKRNDELSVDRNRSAKFRFNSWTKFNLNARAPLNGIMDVAWVGFI